MNSPKDRIKSLLYKYESEKITPSELEELNTYLLDKTYEQVVSQCLDEIFFHDLKERQPQINSAKLYQKIISHPHFNIQPRISATPTRKRWLPKVSAALIVIFVSLFITYQYTGIGELFKADDLISEQHAIIPGIDRAILTNSAGEEAYLSSTHQGISVKHGEITYENGQLLAQPPTDMPLSNSSKAMELRTPRGGQYKIELEDGSKVFLNAESRLRFPSSFGQTNRIVELEGEGYFEISEDENRPFLVKSQNQQIEVLGTKFNVTAYRNDPTITTTLMQGDVRVRVLNTGAVKTLQPGQQVMNDVATNKLRVQLADMEAVSAWSRGYFDFSNQNIQSIMKQIARWYEVEVVYKTAIPDKPLEGSVSRMEHVDDLLNILSSTGMARFHIEGRKIIVTKPKN
ncbi:MAG: FecR family protein [Sphingobacterium sp.]